jgi:ribosomal protein S18 acetylase RimI-like enzyme
MSYQITVTSLESEHLGAAAKLLMRRLESEHRDLPIINSDFLNLGKITEVLANQKNEHLAQGFAALKNHRLIGFVIGKKISESTQGNYLSQITIPNSAGINFLAHAVSEEADAKIVYRELYRELAKNWVSDGYTHHTINISSSDQRIQEAWFDLGFGRHTTITVRPGTGPIRSTQISGLTIKQAQLDDVDTVIDLAELLGKHHISSPMFMFWPVQKKDRKLAKTFFEKLLTNENNPHFIAYNNDHAIGLLSFLSEGFIPPHISSANNIYLFMGIVSEKTQQNGIGHVLLNTGMTWAREHNYKSVTLHVLNMNYSGWPFWEANGFLPIEYSLARTIDSRLKGNNFKN